MSPGNAANNPGSVSEQLRKFSAERRIWYVPVCLMASKAVFLGTLTTRRQHPPSSRKLALETVVPEPSTRFWTSAEEMTP